MPESSRRPLQFPEMFYDIIFTFVINRLSRALLFPNRGVIEWQNIAAFALMILFGWSVWTYQVIYASRVQKSSLLDIVFLALNLFLAIYLTTTINILAELPTSNTKITTSLLLLSLALQYWTGNKDRPEYRLPFVTPLILGAGISIASIFPGQYSLSLGMYVGGLALVALGPWLLRRSIPETTSHFSSINERLALFTLIIFALAAIQVTDSLAHIDIQSLLFFAVIVLMLASYLLVVTLGINIDTKMSSMYALMVHLPINASILMMAIVTRLFLAGRLLPDNFAGWMIVMLAVYTGALAAYLLLYHNVSVDLSMKRGFYFIFSLALFTLYGLVTVRIGALFLTGMCAYLVADDLYLWQFVLNPPAEE